MTLNPKETTETLRTREQRMAESAFRCVEARARGREGGEEYLTFSSSFPSLIHSCGLVQALAFAEAKKNLPLLEDIAQVMKKPLDEIKERARSETLSGYMLLSREVLAAAGWLKRYAQAIIKGTGGGA